MKIVMLVMMMTVKNRMRSTLPSSGNGDDDADNGEDKDDGGG